VADYAGGVTALSVASAMPLLYSQFVETVPAYVPQGAELEPVGA
jgi:hypothetical protein